MPLHPEAELVATQKTAFSVTAPPMWILHRQVGWSRKVSVLLPSKGLTVSAEPGLLLVSLGLSFWLFAVVALCVVLLFFYLIIGLGLFLSIWFVSLPQVMLLPLFLTIVIFTSVIRDYKCSQDCISNPNKLQYLGVEEEPCNHVGTSSAVLGRDPGLHLMCCNCWTWLSFALLLSSFGAPSII